jgi:hypothetical protein
VLPVGRRDLGAAGNSSSSSAPRVVIGVTHVFGCQFVWRVRRALARRNPPYPSRGRRNTLAPAKETGAALFRPTVLVEALNDAGVREKLKPVMQVESSTRDALRGMVTRDIDRYGKLVCDVGMKAE